MKLLYDFHKESKPTFTNFGDELNHWIWPKLMPELIDNDDSVLFVGIGTVLDDTLPEEPVKVIFGAGNGYRPKPVIDGSFRFYCVRGPLTAELLGLPSTMAVTDPAVLVGRLLADQTQQTKKGVVLMGHHTSASHGDWSFACQELGMSYIHPLWPRSRILESISRAELVISEAMHGAIVADALRVPWVPIITSASECRFKWNDWTKSLGLRYDPIVLPALWDLASPPVAPQARFRRWIKRRQFLARLKPNRIAARAQLSSDLVIEARISRLLEELARLKRDSARDGWLNN